MAYGPGEGLMQGVIAGTTLRMKREELEEYKKTQQMRRDELGLAIEDKRIAQEKTLRLKGVDDWYAVQKDRIDKATRDGSILGEFNLEDPETFVANARPKKPAPAPAPQPTGLSAILSRLGISPETQPAGIQAPQGGPAPAPAAAGIQSPGAEEQTPEDKISKNILIPAGSNDPKAMARRYEMLRELGTKRLTLRGEVDKIPAFEKEFAAGINSDWDKRAGATAALLINGSPGGVEKLAQLYGEFEDGYSIDPQSGTFDQKTGTIKGVVRINDQTGEKTNFDITPAWVVGFVKKYDALGAAQAKITLDKDAVDKAYKEGTIEVNKGNLEVSRFNADTQRMTARTGAAREDRLATDTLNARNEQIAQNMGLKEFPRAGTTVTTDDEQGFTGTDKKEVDAQRDALKARIAADTRGRNIFMNLVAGNPRAPKNTLIALARDLAAGRQRDLDGKIDKDGNEYVIYRGQKILF